MCCGAGLQRVPKRLQDDQGNWLTKSQFRRMNGGHNNKWNATLAKWRAQWRTLDVFQLQVLVAERDAALANARLEAQRMHQRLSEVQEEALYSVQKADQNQEALRFVQSQAEESLVEANIRNAQLTSDRDRAADGRRAARKDARQAEAARRRAQQRLGVAERRAGELERRLGFAERECERCTAALEAAHVGAAYWQQRALSAEGQLRGTRRLRARCAEQKEIKRMARADAESYRSRQTALEELARDSELNCLKECCRSAQYTPPRAEAESQAEPTLPRSSTPTGSTAADEHRTRPGGARALFEARAVSETSTAADVADLEVPATGLPVVNQERIPCSCQRFEGDCVEAAVACDDAVELTPPRPPQGSAQRASLLMQHDAQVGRERSCAAAAKAFALPPSYAQGRERDQMREELKHREELQRAQRRASADTCPLALVRSAGEAAALVQREEEFDRVLSRAAATQERAGILVRVSQLRAVRAELRLLPHSEIAERARLEIEQSEAHWKLAGSWRHPSALGDAEVTRTGARIAQPLQQHVHSTSSEWSHPDAGWFLTLDVISLGVAQFAPRGWAPLCRSTASSVYVVHQHWLTAAREVHQKMIARLDPAFEGPEEERFYGAEHEWESFIRRISNGIIPSDERESRRILLMHARCALSILQQLRLHMQQVGQFARHVVARNRSTTAAMRAILWSEELDGELTQ